MDRLARTWRPPLVAAGVVLLAGGGMHPDVDPAGPMTEDLAAMAADDAWVPGHALVLVSTVLLAAGLWGAVRSAAWPSTLRRPLRLAALAVSLYVVETVFHLFAFVDADTLHDGGFAPFAGAHVALSVVLYPLSGAAVAALGWATARATSGARRAVGGVAVVAGTLQALAVPFTVLLPDAENTPLFAGGAVLLAVWSVLTGLTGAPRTVAPQRDLVLAA